MELAPKKARRLKAVLCLGLVQASFKNVARFP
jgi:hypothetical protein